jgi:PKD repeat protein
VQASLHYSLYATVTTSSNTPPVPAIAAPSSSLTWKVGDSISFSGGATDAQDGTEPAARLSWSVVLHHCPSTCHTHTVQTFAGVASGSLQAPDHDYPSYLELVLTATDAAGASASTSVNLQPQTVDLTFASSPTGASLTVGTGANVAPFTRTVIVGSSNSVSAPSQTIGGTAYTFTSWSDSGAQTHNLVAPATATTYTATFGTGPANTPPVAAATATPTSGTAPLTVAFDGSGSSDADAGDTLTYSWDLNGDGTFGDSFAINPSYTFASAGSYTPKLRVTDNHGASTTTSAPTITVSPASTGGGTFGTTTVGPSSDTGNVDVKTVSKFTAVAGQVTKLTGYVSGLGARNGSQPLRAVLYTDSGGRPGALLGVSSEVTINAGRAWGWVDFPLPASVPVSAGTIWMGYIAGWKSGVTQLRYSGLTGDERHNKNTGGYAAGPSNPFGTATTASLHYSLYATYTP